MVGKSQLPLPHLANCKLCNKKNKKQEVEQSWQQIHLFRKSWQASILDHDEFWWHVPTEKKKEEFVNYSKLLSPKKAKPRVTQTAVSRKSSPKKVEPQKLVVDFYSMAVLYIGDNRFQLPHPRISLSHSSLFSRRAKVLSACCGWLVWHLGCVSVTFALMIFTLGLMEWLESKVVRRVQVQFRECN